MGFTAKLGTSDSYLGNIVLGAPDAGGGPGNYNDSISIDGIADAARASTGSFLHVLTISGFSSAEGSPGSSAYFNTLALSGVCALAIVDGQQYFLFRALDAVSGILQLPGFAFTETLDLDGLSDLSVSELTFVVLVLAIDGVADVAQASLQNGRISLSVAGVSEVSVAPNFAYVQTLAVPGIATLYRGSALNAGGDDGLYNFLALASNDTTAQVVERYTSTSENPSSQGSISVACSAVLNRTVVQTLALTQTPAIKKPTEIIDTFHVVSQTAGVQRVRIRSATQTLSMTQEALAYRAFSQTLVFAGTAAVTKVISQRVAQSLVLAQSAVRLTVLNRTLSDTLSMGQNRVVRAPITGTISSSNPTGFEYAQPTARAILVPIRCLVVLGVPAQTVILPCPQFGDSQARQSTINLKRTMTGETYTYVRRTELQKLKYSFQVGTYKAIELKQFLLDHCHEIITLINHKGETWYVNLSNNPFEFTASERWQHKGERHDITLEFEGVRQ